MSIRKKAVRRSVKKKAKKAARSSKSGAFISENRGPRYRVSDTLRPPPTPKKQ